jgi:hypothetical protein
MATKKLQWTGPISKRHGRHEAPAEAGQGCYRRQRSVTACSRIEDLPAKEALNDATAHVSFQTGLATPPRMSTTFS